MKNLYESILDDEEDLITAAQDYGLNGFGDLVDKITDELNSRFDKMRKDSKLKNLIFPEKYDIYKDIYNIVSGRNIGRAFESDSLKLIIKRKDNKTVDELHKDLKKWGSNLEYLDEFPHEIKIVVKYFDKDFNTRYPGYKRIKLKCNIGTVTISTYPEEGWHSNVYDNTTEYRLVYKFKYNPSTYSVRASKNAKIG